MPGDIRFSPMTQSVLGRMDSMTNMVNPSLTHEEILSELQANLELLYIKAKNFHWNVNGVGFQGVHQMFDTIQDFALESADRVAERMRYYQWPIRASAAAYLQKAWFPEGASYLDADGMLMDMSNTLQCFHDHIIERMDLIPCPVSQNMTQDICEQLDKFNYFCKSNMSQMPPATHTNGM